MRQLRPAAVDEIEHVIRDLWPEDGRAREKAEAIEQDCSDYNVPVWLARTFLAYMEAEGEALTLADWRRTCLWLAERRKTPAVQPSLFSGAGNMSAFDPKR